MNTGFTIHVTLSSQNGSNEDAQKCISEINNLAKKYNIENPTITQTNWHLDQQSQQNFHGGQQQSERTYAREGSQHSKVA